MVSCDAGMSPFRGQLIVNNRTVSYLRWGDAAPQLVLLHGVTSSARSWWRVAPVLANLGFTVTAFDMPGHGESGTLPAHGIDAIAAHISAACAALGITVHTLMGHSWGGATAIGAIAHLAPQQLILIDPLVAHTDTWGAQVVERFSEGIGQAVHQTTPWLTARNKQWHRCDVLWKAEALQQCRREAVEGLFLHSGDWHLLDTQPAFPADTLCLVAADDATVMSATDRTRMTQLLEDRGGMLRQIDGTDHNMHRAGFDLTMPVILEWLKRSTV